MPAYTLPPDTRAVGTGNPPADINAVIDAVTAMGAGLNVLNAAFAGGADPTGAADSTAAIQAALNAVPVNGGTVFFPPGIYLITATLNPTVSGTCILGAGWGTQIRYDGNVVSPAIGMADTTQRRCNIQWLRISQTNATPHGTAIEASYFADSVISHVLIDGGGASGVPPIIGVSYNSTTTLYNVVSDSRILVKGANSIGVRFDTLANSNVVRNCHIIADTSDATSIGLYLNGHSIYVEHVDIENGAGTGISIGAAGHGCTLVAPYLEANGTNLALASGVSAPTIIGGTIEAATTADYTDAGAVTPMILNARSGSGGEHAYTKAAVTDVWQPADVGMAAWNYDPATASNTSITINGTIYLMQVILRHQQTVTNLAVFVSAAAVTATASQNYLALVDSAGVIRGQTAAAAIDTQTQSAGFLSHAMAATYLAPAGKYWVAALFNAATAPTLARGTGASLTGANLGLSAANLRYCVNGTTATALPGSFTPGSNTATGAFTFWAGVS